MIHSTNDKIPVKLLYFSPTGNVKLVIHAVAEGMRRVLPGVVMVEHHDFTLPADRIIAPTFTADDVVLLALPVYAGRIPNLLLPYLRGLQGNGAKVMSLVVYGNRAYDGALAELTGLAVSAGFEPIGAAAFVGRHAFSDAIGTGRPSAEDRRTMHLLGEALMYGLMDEPQPKGLPHKPLQEIVAQINAPMDYYRPCDANGVSMDFRSIKPVTTSDCNRCGVCAEGCPMGAIDHTNPEQVTGICMKCCRCVHRCPAQAKQFMDERFLFHRADLEQRYGHTHAPCDIFLP